MNMYRGKNCSCIRPMAKRNSEKQQEGKERKSHDFLFFWFLSNGEERSHVQNLFSLKILFDNNCGITFQREQVIKNLRKFNSFYMY